MKENYLRSKLNRTNLRLLLLVAAIFAASFLIAPIIVASCTNNQQGLVCADHFAWLGGFHVVDQKLHSSLQVSLAVWHNYLSYRYRSLALLLVTALIISVVTILVYNFYLSMKAKKLKTRAVILRQLLVPFLLIMGIVILNLGMVYTLTNDNLLSPKHLREASPNSVYVPPADSLPDQNDQSNTPLNAPDSGPNSCLGNPQDVCVFAPSVDFYPSGSEGASNPDYHSDNQDAVKEIGGVITSVNGKEVTIQTASGRSFAITFPIEAVAWWNAHIAPNYNNYVIGIGDTLAITYSEPLSKSGTSISADQIAHSSLAIAPENLKAGLPIRRYPLIGQG